MSEPTQTEDIEELDRLEAEREAALQAEQNQELADAMAEAEQQERDDE